MKQYITTEEAVKHCEEENYVIPSTFLSVFSNNLGINLCAVKGFEVETTDEFFRSFADNAMINLHFDVIRGKNAHHIIEAMFKSFARCLREALELHPKLKGSVIYLLKLIP